MSYTLNRLKPDDISSEQRKVSFHGLEFTMEVKKDHNFERAMAIVNESIVGKKKLDKEVLSVRSDLTEQEALLFVIGEYLIKEWNVAEENALSVPINGENFLAVCESFNDVKLIGEFISLVFKTYTELSDAFFEKRMGIKKKP